jgi:hypothetical protein
VQTGIRTVQGLPACGDGADCFVNPEGVPERDCPYDIQVLRRDPMPQEQKAWTDRRGRQSWTFWPSLREL